MPRIRQLVWGTSFRRAFRRRVIGTVREGAFRETLTVFVEDPFDRRLRTHKLTGKLEGLWAFTVAHDCRVVFKFLESDQALLIDIGTHSEVY